MTNHYFVKNVKSTLHLLPVTLIFKSPIKHDFKQPER